MAEQEQEQEQDYKYQQSRNKFVIKIDKLLTLFDDVILVLVGLGIIGVAVLLMIEAVSDFINLNQHSVSHIISDLMFVLIIMELFRQVMRQLKRHTFSLNPFIYIGVIASIRGLLLTQMKLGMGETEWSGGVVQIGVHAVIVLILVYAFSVYAKHQKQMGEK